MNGFQGMQLNILSYFDQIREIALNNIIDPFILFHLIPNQKV